MQQWSSRASGDTRVRAETACVPRITNLLLLTAGGMRLATMISEGRPCSQCLDLLGKQVLVVFRLAVSILHSLFCHCMAAHHVQTARQRRPPLEQARGFVEGFCLCVLCVSCPCLDSNLFRPGFLWFSPGFLWLACLLWLLALLACFACLLCWFALVVLALLALLAYLVGLL